MTTRRTTHEIHSNLGKADGFYPNTLIDMINDNVKGRVAIGKIDILPNFSFFEVDEKTTRNIIGGLKNINFFGKRVTLCQSTRRIDKGVCRIQKLHPFTFS